ncbi:dihydroxyacetone kinase subunit DhaK [Mycolicibacterium mageritense]|nr:dihydroxyacetone kinase subunit DhaK [Mycolicibacterium mageritense]MCC9185710.1 dihydroxyacetone kinase subunit DhaK [Mycolicibacterium mageritense]BDY31058.1 L-erythrulose kinase [Mycolicibacterium mageritense]CDO24345.1 dihydroxyacetone kinase [Mycolicibacterium mageritense DSM 44476 = CIP 104973]
MRKFINKPGDVAMETLEGYLAVTSGRTSRVPGTLGLIRRELTDRVVVLVGGGSGHEPVWLEYVGEGLADAVCQGDVFAAPDPMSIATVAAAAHRGHGVLFLYGNYAGDRLNFDLAAEELAADGIVTRTVRVADDVAAAPFDRRDDRRGIAGGYFATRIAAAAAARGDHLDAVADITQRAVDRTRSIGVAGAGGTIPGSDEPTLVVPDGRLEIGMGMHGEKGVWAGDFLSADATTDKMLELLLTDRPLDGNHPVAVLVNGLGATTRAELLIVSRRLLNCLAEQAIEVVDTHIGEYATSQEMHGFSISLFELDDELTQLYHGSVEATFAGGLA